ncbi:MAG: hypothetical protein HOW97_18670 [Catenulispora sp.]|nr:hypothetical protein [Catenulispora sp.]
MRRSYGLAETLAAAGITAATAFFTVVTTWRREWTAASVATAIFMWTLIAASAWLAVVSRRLAARPAAGSVGEEFPAFPTGSYLRSVEDAKRLVRIQDAYIAFLLEPESRERAMVAFRRLLQDGGGRVEIVLMEPQATEAGLRAAALNAAWDGPPDYRDYVERLRANLCHLYQFRKTLTEPARSRFEVTLVSWLPGVTCYQADDVLLTAVFPLYHRSDEAPQIRVPEDSRPGLVVAETFRFLRDRVGHGFEERMLLAVAAAEAGGQAGDRGCDRLMPYVGPDSDDRVYVIAGDCAIADGEPVVADVPDDDGDSVRRRYRARVFERTDARFADVASAMLRKYGDEVAEERVLALLPA